MRDNGPTFSRPGPDDSEPEDLTPEEAETNRRIKAGEDAFDRRSTQPHPFQPEDRSMQCTWCGMNLGHASHYNRYGVYFRPEDFKREER